MNLKNIFISIYIVLTFLMFLFIEASFKIKTSFLFSSIILFMITVYHLYYEKGFSPFISSYIVFSYLFFIAAPLSQINLFSGLQNPLFRTKFPYSENLAIYANTLITFFHIIFIIFYISFKKKILNKLKPEILDSFSFKILPLKILIFTVLNIIILILSYDFMQVEFLRTSFKKSTFSIPLLMLWKKFLFFIPFSTVIMCFQYFKKKNKKKNNLLNIVFFLLISIMLLLWFKNPITEKRNALGPIYISLIFLFVPKVLNTNIKVVSFLFFSMIIIFPLTAIITHTDATIMEMYANPMIVINETKGGGITNAFNTLNYDAFANMNATIDYVHKNGFSYGYQLLGGLFFFMPRSFWTSKPISSGELIGDYLVSDYGFNFTNLSNPFISEGFINFGILGIIIFPIILAYVFVRMIVWLRSDNYLKKIMSFYFAIHLIFFLRGDFTNGYSYYVAPLIAVVLIPRIAEIILNNLLRNK